ncbi:MAG: outer membrane protein assembly factor BamA [Nitrospiraceae bacterium]|nr:MAG: outer membrane protein assembly factor BamA [Nitrospiraceae bacterium]
MTKVNFEYCKFLAAIFIALFFFLPGVPAVSAESGPLVKSVELQDNRKISAETILAKIKSSVGGPFSKNTVQEDIKRLYGTGYFDDIRVEIDSFEGGIKLVFIFTEKPTISSIDFQGHKEFETEKLKEKITITSGAIANLPLITDNVQKIVSFYQSEGHWLVSVLPVIREISKDTVALTFQIEEGPKVGIKDIIIEGNKSLSSKEIRKAMKTKEKWLFSFLTGSGVYEKEQVRADLENIRELYQNKGFIYAAVREPELSLSQDKKKLTLKISVSEGEQYKIGELKVTGNVLFESSELFKNMDIASGQVFNRSALRSTIDRIVDLYMDKGYARADIDPLIDVNEKDKLANITLSLSEGGLYRIGKIEISGNTKTRDKVIRREMRLDEGDIFSKQLLKRSYQRINNLNFFETVDLAPAPHAEADLIDIDVKVKEKLTGMLSIGGGYSSVDKFMIMGEITQANLFGKGLYLKFKADFSSRRKNYNISLRDAWFMDRPISAAFSLYNESFEFPDYDKKASGGSVSFGKELSEYVQGEIAYNLEEAEIADVADDASSLIKDQVGRKITSSISPSISRDTRDNYIDPTSGSRHALYTKLAGLGGDNYFYKSVVDSVWYFPFKWDTAFSARGRVGAGRGYSDRELPLYERFYVGGINTIRGLGFGEGGPRDEDGEVIGGDKELIFNAEYIFPISKEAKLKGVIFYDYGRAFDDGERITLKDMRSTAGAGVRWMSPFGPLRLEWGVNLDPQEDENNNKLEFSIGGVF